MKTKDLRGTWPQALGSFFLPLILVFAFRWIVFEPFAIPSGSMIPTLLVHDYIFVSKWKYGIKSPLGTSNWWWMWRQPQRGDVVVFRYPKNPQVYYIKRLIGLPGEEILMKGQQIFVNGKAFQDPWGKYKFSSESDSNEEIFQIPEHEYFMLGDNRDESQDSRYWGFVPEKNLVGPASFIWMSCENTLESSPLVCDPTKMRWARVFTGVN